MFIINCESPGLRGDRDTDAGGAWGTIEAYCGTATGMVNAGAQVLGNVWERYTGPRDSGIQKSMTDAIQPAELHTGLQDSGKQDRVVLERNGTDVTGEGRPPVFGSGRDFRGLTGTKGCHGERMPCIRRFV